MSLELEKINRGTEPTPDGAGTDDAWTFTGKINRNFAELEKEENASSRKVGVEEDQVPTAGMLGKAPAIIDGLRRQVEASSGGQMTVLYTDKGQASYFFAVPKFNAKDLDPALPDQTHPMFIMDGEEVDRRFIGAYQGVLVNGELLSLPGVDATASRNIDQYLSYARACGPGFGLMTNMDAAGLALWCRANGHYPGGNMDFGRDRHKPHETGIRQDGKPVGENHGNDRTLTGSGPASWRHNNSIFGISDLVGNAYEWVPGIRFVDGEIQIIKDNDMALDSADFSAASTQWRAIDAATGELISPGESGAVKFVIGGAEEGALSISSSGANYSSIVATGISSEAVALLTMLGVNPPGSDIPNDRFYINVEGERVLRRFGHWHPNYRQGVFMARGHNGRTYATSAAVARPAFGRRS